MRDLRLLASGALAVTAAACLAWAAGAAALPAGVHVDPGSPAAKEYSLLLPQARGVGASGGGTTGEPLFGAGLHAASGGARRPSGGASAGSSTPAGSKRAAVPASSPALPAQVVQATRGLAAHDGGSGLAALIGGGVAVLVLSVLGGTVFRRSRRGAPPA